MSAAEILAELSRLTPDERRHIARRLAQLEAGEGSTGFGTMTVNEAAELRGRLDRFADEWDSPEMRIYDEYDAAKAGL